MRIALFGAPGVGKGSQARLLMESNDIEHISTGIILREAIRNGTPTGTLAREYIENSRLVPGPVVRKLAESAIAAAGFDRFVLDGYPRTIEQAEWLTEFLIEHRTSLQAVVSLCVPDDVIVNRLSKRRVNMETGENYHLDFKPPPEDVDPSLVYQREDDWPESIVKRLAVYREETHPVEDYYRVRNLLLEVDGLGAFDAIHDRIVEAVRIFVSSA
ncbi:MAG: nucleoside monophosphate kinase [Bacteroidetes bacterium]|nr:nucleoside monophosphate kinase [Bacteroidota bacterium]